MILPPTFAALDWKRILELTDSQNVKQGGTFEVGPGRVVLRDANGVRWRLNVSTAGVLSASVVTN
jgi:hypothetical protein